MKKIRISPLFALWVIIFAQFQSDLMIPLICAIILHELGHLLVAKILKIKIKRLHLSMLGARIETKDSLSYRDEFLLAAAGPFFGFLFFALSLPIAIKFSESSISYNFLLPFAVSNIALALFNLIPLSTLDGGRMLFCILCRLFSLDTATKIIRLTSFFTLFSFWIFSTYLMLKISTGLSMLVFCSIFFAKCFIFNTKTHDFESF